VIKKEVEKILKHKDLITDIQRLWNCESKVIPVITGATETTSKSLRQYVSNVRGKHEIKIQNRLHGRNNITYTYSTNYKYGTAATQYTLETWFVSRIYYCQYHLYRL